MAANSLDSILLASWRQFAAAAVAAALLHLGASNVRADEGVVYVADDQEQADSGALDIADALSSAADSDEAADEQVVEEGVEQFAFTQPGSAAEAELGELAEGQGEAPIESAAEEVAASDEIDELDQLEGPPTWARILRPITEVTADATLPAGLLPDQVEHEGDAPRAEMMPEVSDPRLMGGWGDNVFNWSAASSWHHPLYFEEVNLERYGYQCHPLAQPFVSGAHFFLTVPTLPYQMTVHPPKECIYTLGHYRPGSCAPWQRNRLPWDPRAAAVEAGVVVGLVFLIP
jgi:hypothetical protein